MAKKERTPEQIQADKERMAKVRASRSKDTVEEAVHPEPQADTISQSQYSELVKQIQELKSLGFDKMVAQGGGAQVTDRGIIGIHEKHPVNPDLYPDPTERLVKEPALKRFAFGENYSLDYELTTSQYETKDGMNVKEPRFNLQLNRVIYDDATGEDTGKRAVIARQILHEDPQSALIVAREQGLEIPDDIQVPFLNEMRYLQMRDWLLGCFMPPATTNKKEKGEMVIGGQVVETFEITSENSESVSFDRFKNKLR